MIEEDIMLTPEQQATVGQAINGIRDAMNDYTRMTCISFVQRTNQRDYVRFFPGNGYDMQAMTTKYIQLIITPVCIAAASLSLEE